MKVFTSDLHHKHKNICQFTDRHKFTTQEHHDEWIKDLWNKSVTPTDTIWHLGDLSFAHKYDDIANFIYGLNGQIFLIKGNHDRSENLNRLKQDGLIQNWYEYKEIKIGETKTVLFHYPISAWHQQHRDSIMLHGHCHGSFTGNGKILDVGLDSAFNITGEHTFFKEEDIKAYAAMKPKHVADHHQPREGE